MMDEWIDITTLEQSFRYVVEMDINSGRTRYRKKYAKDVVGGWHYGELKQKGETNGNIIK